MSEACGMALQAQLKQDTQNFQMGTYVNWTLSNGTVAPAVNTTQTPLQFSVNLQNQTVPTFYDSTWPQFTPLPVGLWQAWPYLCCSSL